MMRVLLPDLPDGRDVCLPDISDDRDYKMAIFATKPWGFEVEWHLQPWPKDKEGYTYVPLMLYNEDRANKLDPRLSWVKHYYALQEKYDKLKKAIKDIG